MTTNDFAACECSKTLEFISRPFGSKPLRLAAV